MASWAERHEQAKLDRGQAKLLTLAFLSEPRNQSHGETWARISGAIHHAGSGIPPRDLHHLLGEMVAEGLLEVGGSHPAHGNIKKPYRITAAGKAYLAGTVDMSPTSDDAPAAVEPEQRTGPPGDWIALILAPRVQKLSAEFLRGLPEFQGSGEARIQEVSRGLAQAIGLPAPRLAHGDAGRSGR